MSQTPPLAEAAHTNGRDRTPELTSKRERRHRENDEDDRDKQSRHRSHRRGEDAAEDPDDDRERERRRRHRHREDETEEERRERKRRHYDEETEEEREERRRRRRERELRERGREYDDRERERDRDRDRRGSRDHSHSQYSHRERDRSRESHRSHRSRDPEILARREMSREEREAERERRDREMQDERREAARLREERMGDRRRERPPPSPPQRMRASPTYEAPAPPTGSPPPKDPVVQFLNNVEHESRSVFVSQLAARMTSRDLGMFFEEMIGRGSVREARVVSDRGARRSKGIAYVELRDVDAVNQALALSGTLVMGIPIQITLTESEKNHEGQIASIMSGGVHSKGVPKPAFVPKINFPPLSTGLKIPPGVDIDAHKDASIPYHRLYVTNVAHSLSPEDVGQVFEAFGDIEFVDLHTNFSGESKGTAYVQFKELRSAQMAVDAMNNFEIAGRPIKVVAVQERSQVAEQLEENNYGPRMDATQRQQLMYKLARTEPPPTASGSPGHKPPPSAKAPPMDPTRFLVVSNMFNPEEETERNWDLDLAEDVKGEVESKYGTIKRIKVDKLSAGDVYIEFETVRSADGAFKGLGGRFFGGRKLEASFISETLFKAHM